MIYVGLVALVIETIRCPDMSAGFGRMSTMTQRLLYEQLGATLLCAVVLVMLATARSLYAQMSRPLPAIFPRLMWGIVAFYQLLIIPVLVSGRCDTPAEQSRGRAGMGECGTRGTA